ncbi:hypothetical protein P19_0297 [Aeromonas phage P19]|uniref:Neck protein n=1 Tax=Aeromonas phage vB_AdhaM_G2 TaxID=3238786 RepID=A0AB39U008_9CAUD|nr:hypothetical protein P19_0297 [Aeromonas phage P19]
MYIQHNLKVDELVRMIDEISPDLARRVDDMIESEIESAMDSWGDQEEFEKGCHKESVRSAIHFSKDPEWLKDNNASKETYYVNYVYRPFHMDNHNVSITRFNNDTWSIDISMGAVGQDGWKGFLRGSVEDVQREVVDTVLDLLQDGLYLKIND